MSQGKPTVTPEKPMEHDDTINDYLRTMLAAAPYKDGSTPCPLCGVRQAHQHSPVEVLIYKNGVKYGRSLIGAPVYCAMYPEGGNVRLSALLAMAEAALRRIAGCEDAPDIYATGEWQKGLRCGVEDRDCRDRYDGADFGHAVGVEKGLEWASNEAMRAIVLMANTEIQERRCRQGAHAMKPTIGCDDTPLITDVRFAALLFAVDELHEFLSKSALEPGDDREGIEIRCSDIFAASLTDRLNDLRKALAPFTAVEPVVGRKEKT